MAALSTSTALNLSVLKAVKPNQSRFLSEGSLHILFWTRKLRTLKPDLMMEEIHSDLTKGKTGSLEAIWQET